MALSQTGKKILILLVIAFIVELVVGILYIGPLKGLGEFLHVVTLFSFKLPSGKTFNVNINLNVLIMTYIVMALLIGFVYFITRDLKEVPGRAQNVAEIIVGFFDDICIDSLGKELGRKYLPLVGTLFLFIAFSNWIGIVPSFWKIIPGINKVIPEWFELSEPTRDINTDLGMAILVFFVVHISAIRIKGIKGYLKSYIDPVFFMAPLNVVGELAKVISHSFRLFGNIMGGAVIIIVISGLIKHIMLPVILSGFFGLFVGTIQAFVFSMLALAYITVAIK